MAHIKITGWSAKRAGGRITITGVSVRTGKALKVVGVDQISGSKAGEPPIAVDKNGATYALV